MKRKKKKRRKKRKRRRWRRRRRRGRRRTRVLSFRGSREQLKKGRRRLKCFKPVI